MKICFVVNECNFFYSHRFVLAKKLSSFAEIFVLTDTSNTQPSVIKKILKNNIRVKEISRRNSQKGILGHLSYFSSLLRAIRVIKPNSIFFVTLELSFFGVIVGWFNRKIACYYLITGLGPYFLKKSIKNIAVNFIFKITFITARKKLHSKFIFQNSDDKDALIKLGFVLDRQSIIIHGSGIDIDNIRFQERDGNKPLSFLFASRLIKGKGVKEFLEAGSMIKKIYPKININIAGKYDPLDPDTISEKLFKKIQESNIYNYLNDIDHDDIQKYYLKSDIFILPSYAEGLPKAAIEAAASGMPLIISKTAGCKECVNHENNGLLVELGDALNLKNAMEKMIINPSLISQMSRNSRQLVKEKFSIDLIFQQYKELVR